MSISRKIRIASNGTIEIVYFDELKNIDLPISVIRRASHVEPDDKANWLADMASSNGPVLGPFATRELALAAEIDWLNKNYLHRAEVEEKGYGKA